jgi:hypothetical protein
MLYDRKIFFVCMTFLMLTFGTIFSFICNANFGEKAQLLVNESILQKTYAQVATTTGDPHTTITNLTDILPQPRERIFYLYNSYIPTLHSLSKSERPDGFPADSFSKTTIAAQKGEKVTVNFFNLESGKGADPHTFTILNKAYNVNLNIKPGENGTANFVANQPGVFDFICIYHMPTMSGQLIVEP